MGLDDEAVNETLQAAGRRRDDCKMRDAMLHQTLGVLRLRRRWKKSVRALCFVACYVGGIATAVLPGLVPPQRPTSPTVVVVPPSEPKMTPVERARRDADASLIDQGDVKEAVRHYNRFLELASADQQAIHPNEDSWLLMALKDSRRREKRHDASE